MTLLVLLDLSAAFDTVDHKILLQRLQSMLGIRGSALSWFRSYLEGRSQQVSINGTLSRRFELSCGVPQGSCLGPLLFTIYFSKLFDILKFHLPTPHGYADDTQLYLSFSPNDSSSEVEAVSAIENCIRDIHQWMTEDNLMLNDGKTEFLLIGTQMQLTKVSIESINLVPRVSLLRERDPGPVWSRASQTIENIREGSSNFTFFVYSFVNFKARLLHSHALPTAITRDVL